MQHQSFFGRWEVTRQIKLNLSLSETSQDQHSRGHWGPLAHKHTLKCVCFSVLVIVSWLYCKTFYRSSSGNEICLAFHSYMLVNALNLILMRNGLTSKSCHNFPTDFLRDRPPCLSLCSQHKPQQCSIIACGKNR